MSICWISMTAGVLLGWLAYVLGAKDLAVGLWVSALVVPCILVSLAVAYVRPWRRCCIKR